MTSPRRISPKVLLLDFVRLIDAIFSNSLRIFPPSLGTSSRPQSPSPFLSGNSPFLPVPLWTLRFVSGAQEAPLMALPDGKPFFLPPLDGFFPTSQARFLSVHSICMAASAFPSKAASKGLVPCCPLFREAALNFLPLPPGFFLNESYL